jgi:hypothetical protein
MKRVFGFSALFTLFELLLCLVLSPGAGTPSEKFLMVPFPPGWDQTVGQDNPILFRYVRLSNWDSFHYYSGAKYGYHAPAEGWTREDVNGYRIEFSFLPAFPFFARAISKVTTLPLEIALPLASQIFAFLFYVFFLLILQRICLLPEETALVVVGLFSVTPGAFYVVTAYSESIFLCSIAGMIFFAEMWTKSEQLRDWIMAGVFAFIATWSRMLGVVLGLFPFCLALRSGFSFKKRIGALLLAGFAGVGTASYLAFCQIQSGHWDAYFRLANVGWDMHPMYLGSLNPLLYIPRPFFEEGESTLHRSILLLCLVAFFGALFKDADRRSRLSYYATGLALFYLTVAGKADMGLQGMTRYALPLFFLAILPLSTVFRTQVIELLRPRKVVFLAALFIFGFECFYCFRYMHGRWVS